MSCTPEPHKAAAELMAEWLDDQNRSPVPPFVGLYRCPGCGKGYGSLKALRHHQSATEAQVKQE